MPRASVSFSGDHLELEDIAVFHADAVCGFRLIHDPAQPGFLVRFAAMSSAEVASHLQVELDELGRMSSLSVLAAVEAAFRMDYLVRVNERRRDVLSRAMRELYSRSGSRVSFEDEILELWRDNTSGARQAISDLKGAMKYRHWLAHGRYWTPKMGRSKYDFQSIYEMAEAILVGFPLVSVDR